MNDEQRQAVRDVEHAIAKYLHAFGRIRANETVTAWATVICLEDFEDEGVVNYALALSGGIQPAHITAGLLQCGVWCVDGTYQLVEDETE